VDQSTPSASSMRPARVVCGESAEYHPASVVAMRVNANALGADMHVGRPVLPQDDAPRLPGALRRAVAVMHGAFTANLARVGRVDVQPRTRHPSWGVGGSGDRRIPGVSLPPREASSKTGRARLLSGRGGLVPPQQALAAQGTVAREHGSAGHRRAERRAPGHVPALGTGAHRHRLRLQRPAPADCAGGSHPLATSFPRSPACRRRHRPSRAPRRRSPRW
jgi:hypothetical protein